jgi:hypothetical protein
MMTNVVPTATRTCFGLIAISGSFKTRVSTGRKSTSVSGCARGRLGLIAAPVDGLGQPTIGSRAPRLRSNYPGTGGRPDTMRAFCRLASLAHPGAQTLWRLA